MVGVLVVMMAGMLVDMMIGRMIEIVVGILVEMMVGMLVMMMGRTMVEVMVGSMKNEKCQLSPWVVAAPGSFLLGYQSGFSSLSLSPSFLHTLPTTSFSLTHPPPTLQIYTGFKIHLRWLNYLQTCNFWE
jgi:hypothetical protein